MNRIHKIIWSEIREKWIVVSEKAGAAGCPIVLRGALSIAALVALWSPAAALSPTELPTGGVITAGSGAITTSGSEMTVRQTSQKLVADWNTFNIGSNASVTFRQPDATASALNRIHDLDPSQIMGKLTANGQLFLINQSGIIFGKTAQVNVGGVVATSLNMADRDFLEGKYRFSRTGSAGPVINQGVIEAMPGGVVALIAPQVENDGAIQADGGSAALLAGDKVSVDFGGDDMINFVIAEGAVQAQASNKGLIQADGGVAVMSARAASELARAAVNNTGIVQARTFENRAGKIVLVSDMKTGTTSVAGTLDASAPNGGNGGFIETSGATVKIADGAKIDTRAAYGKNGAWLIDLNDFTIAASGGDISGATLGSNLNAGNVTILSSSGATAGNGDIFVNDNVTWSANTLTLNAYRNITVNSAMNATGTASLALQYGQGSTDGSISGKAALFTAKAPVNLTSTASFSTQLGSAGATKNYTVISTLAQLQGMSLTGNYVLGADIIASGSFTPIGGWISDATYAADKKTDLYSALSPYMFQGMFEGAGHTISNLAISGAGNSVVGLFDAAYNLSSSSQIIENLHLSGVNVSGDIRVGALAGVIGPTTKVYNVSVTGSSISGMSNVGGLVGISLGTIASTSATENTVTQSSSSTAFGTLQDSLGILENYGNVGGFLGRLDGGTVAESTSSGSVNTAAASINIGGFAGYITSGSVSESYSTGWVNVGSGSSNIGGFAGYIEGGSVLQSYSTGMITPGSGSTGIGGFAGYNGGTITSAFWDVETSGIGTAGSSTGGIGGGTLTGVVMMGKSTSGMMNLTVGDPRTSDFDGSVWGIIPGVSYPYFLWQYPTTPEVISGTLSTSISGHSAAGKSIVLADNGSKIGQTTTGKNGFYYFIMPRDTVLPGTNDIVFVSGDASVKANSVSYVNSSEQVTGFNLVDGLLSVSRSDASGPLLPTEALSTVRGSLSGYESDILYSVSGGNVTLNADTLFKSASAIGSNGDIIVNGAVSWSANTLTLNAYRNITVNSEMNATGSGSLSLQYGQGAVASGNTAVVNINAPVNLPEGNHFSTKLGSDGTPKIYYVITSLGLDVSTTGTDLQGINGNLSRNYSLGANIDASATSGWNGGAGFSPIEAFVGLFEGLGQTISGLTINQPTQSFVGLFGYFGTGGAISNVGLVGGAITGNSKVGGLVGENAGSVTSSYATGSVKGNGDSVGGLVGSNFGPVTSSHATGSVSGGGYVGGLVGWNEGTVTSSYATVLLTAGNWQVGGLVGSNHGQITSSYATGSVTSSTYAGGLVGYNAGTVKQSYATGAVSGGSYLGGLVGLNDGAITNAFWDVEISGIGTADKSDGGIGGGTLSGVIGKSTAQMKSLATYAGWDISATGGDGKSWRIYEGQTTPLLRTFLTSLTVTGLSATTPVTYDGLSHTMPVSGTPVFTGFVDGDTSASLGQSQYKNAGIYEPWYSSKYDIILSSGNGSLTVNKAPITVTANNDSKTYNGLVVQRG